MESISYDRFTTPEAEISNMSHKFIEDCSSGRRSRLMYIIFGILALYVLILTLTVGIKLSQVSKEVADVKHSVKSLNVAPEFDNAHFSELVMPEQGACQQDWVFYKGSCYYQSTVKKNWKTAEDICVQKGAHLVVTNDLAELEFVSSFVKLSNSYWIGLEEKEEGHWSWVDGTDISETELHWDAGQPDNWDVRLNGEDCGQIHSASVFEKWRLWNDADCTLSYPFVCEGKPKS
ncbi:hypothetical protein DNTS_015204 [Danionella cerebrum]|uniref:C-type lectin domain-containing protein n=1 Tax=Danionella cerebrum TaxID=2873325 RepID=A0A553NJK2_9TELE|nr:hypothetical protein DNTS_015204 [Danionella translucida]